MPRTHASKLRNPLKRDINAAALERFELSCRTLADFEQLVTIYDKLDANAERKIRYWERLHYDALEDWHCGDNPVIPRPIQHEWWRSLLRGDFLDQIFDCPHDIHELTASRNVCAILKPISADQKEILYYRSIRLWSPQRLAEYRGQTDRNIRKVYSNLIDELQTKLFRRLLWQFACGGWLTPREREFCVKFCAAIDEGIDYQVTYAKPHKEIRILEPVIDDDIPDKEADYEDEDYEKSYSKTKPEETFFDSFHIDEDGFEVKGSSTTHDHYWHSKTRTVNADETE